MSRENLFVTTKIQVEFKDYQTAKKSIDESLQRLNLNYLDLLLIHSPEPWVEFHNKENHYFEENIEVWRAMEEAVNNGKVRSIGVSNFKKADLNNILEHSTIKPVVNQLLIHIGNTDFGLLEQAQQNNVLVEAYSPVAHGEILQNPEIKQMADKYQISIPQLAIRYCLELGTLPLPKSQTLSHVANNADVDFEISKQDLEELKKLPQINSYGDSSSFPVFSGK
ncbi:aldo/keto reductase [Weissella paramesenteroides]|uniref:aldo/keto reductase n=1 Tax=Weissella paramesenteroides TaxID=1249 RepID=UPI0023F68F04|nr:aldo/keto reductase [Weissella paramesenteroides]